MQTVHIDQLETHFRMKRHALDQRKRLDDVLRPVLDGMLEEALDRVGVTPHEEICIREVRVPLRLRLRQSDRELALAWSLALAEGIQKASLRRETEWAVRYGSRFHALIDFAIGVARRDLRRNWAWRQLGFTAERLTAASAPHSLTRALVNDPVSIVPVLRAVVQQNEFGRLMRRLEPAAWSTLAATAVEAGGGNAARILSANAPAIDRQPASRRSPEILRRRLARSPLARAISAEPAYLLTAPETCWPLAVLVCLDDEPSFLQRGTDSAYAHVQTANEQLLAMSSPVDELPLAMTVSDSVESPPPRIDLPDSPPAEPNMTEHAMSPDEAGPAIRQTTDRDSSHVPTSDLVMGPPPKTDSPDTPLTQPNTTEAALSPDDDVTPCQHQAAAPAEPQPAGDRDAAAEPRPLPAVRQQAVTTYGGLLLLVHVLTELDFCERIAGNRTLDDRALPWVLHQLGRMLVSTSEDDPAVLALAGLTPLATPPSRDEPPATDAELAELAQWVKRITRSLPLRLDQPDRAGIVLLDWLCRRRAEVVADPGWIEVHFSLDDASTELRRSGLDLDPGYVPWLGVVLSFVYE